LKYYLFTPDTQNYEQSFKKKCLEFEKPNNFLEMGVFLSGTVLHTYMGEITNEKLIRQGIWTSKVHTKELSF
jgi:hypothetical protein